MCVVQANILSNQVVLHFADGATASRNVAGLPAAARAVRELALAGVEQCWLTTGDGWRPDRVLRSEVKRLAGAMRVSFAADRDKARFCGGGGVLWLAGEAIAAALPARASLMSLAMESGAADRAASAAAFDGAAHRIIAATRKPGDGIISRTLNRPISQAISRLLLRAPLIRPIHATWLTALLAAAMLTCLLWGGEAGLLAGALLFQAASIIDGVDGEIARATFRSTDFGAKLDSLVDAATNIGFIAGVVMNLWIAGSHNASLAGGAGLVLMALGLFLIGRQAGTDGTPFTFNAVKDHFRTSGSRLMQCLTWLTMRDFFAFAAVLFVVSGLAEAGLVIFATVAAGWLAVVLVVIGASSRQRA